MKRSAIQSILIRLQQQSPIPLYQGMGLWRFTLPLRVYRHGRGLLYLLTDTVRFSLLTYLKKTGKATKKATQIRYSTPLICE